MSKRTPEHIREAIKVDLRTSLYTNAAVSRMHGVNKDLVGKLMLEVLHEQRKTDKGVCGLLPREEPYQTEEEMLYPRSHYYGATNKHLIRTINPDWKLIDYES